MNNEPKTDLLLRMMEQPELYTDEQWCDILSDDECRQLYTLMAQTRGATDATQADAALTEEDIAAEWEKVKGMTNDESRFARNDESHFAQNDESRCAQSAESHFAQNAEYKSPSNPEGNFYSSFVIRHSSFKKIAAVLLAAVFLGGLAWAFVPRFITPKANAPQSAEAATPRLDGEREGVLPVSFNDMRLDSILSVVATHYHHAVCFRDSSLRALHFYTTWDDSQPIDSFLTTLDEFEGLRLSRERDTIFVESETGEEAQ